MRFLIEFITPSRLIDTRPVERKEEAHVGRER
jgi:hypothetical protein